MKRDLEKKRAVHKKTNRGGFNVEIVGVEVDEEEKASPQKESEEPKTPAAGGSVYVSEKDKARIASRREVEEKKKEEEYQQNYDEYQNYLKLIGKVLDVGDEGPGGRGSYTHGSNNPPTQCEGDEDDALADSLAMSAMSA